jgi:hypothetical protein
MFAGVLLLTLGTLNVIDGIPANSLPGSLGCGRVKPSSSRHDSPPYAGSQPVPRAIASVGISRGECCIIDSAAAHPKGVMAGG